LSNSKFRLSFGPAAAVEIARVFPLEKKALYVGFGGEESLFSQALQNFE